MTKFCQQKSDGRSVQYRDFGRTNWQVSEISFGAWQLGGDWGPVDDAASVDTLLYAFDQGINFVDTAELYGAGHSEQVVGEALRQWNGHKIYVATKCQPTVWPSPDDDSPAMAGRYPAWHLRANVENSLRRLGVDCIDLYQLHCWMPSGTRTLDWLETLNDLRIEGKIDHVGVSLRDYRAAEGADLARLGLVASQQVIVNLFEQSAVTDLFPAGNDDTAFIARVPLDSGSLVGHWTPHTYGSWAPESVPHKMFAGERFAETLARVEALKELCRRYYATLAEAAMRYVLSTGHVRTVIPGMTTRAEVDMNVVYSDGAAFPQALADAVAEHKWVRNYYRETATNDQRVE
jgi:aryl-alcohol dehydrogenase-like predicted oxidoreductase